MKENDLVSIIIPCYNQAQYLEEAVQSVLDQTYPNIEIIIVNDGSPDNTQEVALELQKKYPEKIQIISQENSGLSAARNSGIEKSSGKYIIPLDADDKLHNTMVQKCINTMNEYNADIVYSGYQGFGISDRVNMWKPFEQTTPLYNTPCSALALIKKKVWETNNGYKQNMHDGYEDWEFWINAYKHNFRFKHINEKLYFYRIKDESMFVDAYKKDMYLRAKIVMNHPELYTAHRTLQATRTIKEAEKLADLYFYFTQDTTIDTDQFNSVLNNYLNNNSLNKIQVITFLDMNIGLCTLDLFEDIHSLDDLSKELGTDLIFFYSPLLYEVSELRHSKFAWDQNKGIVKSQGTLFPFVPISVKDDLKNTKFTAKNLEMYYEYTKNKMDNLQHKYNIDISNAQKKFDSLQHKYNIDTDTARKKLESLQYKYNMDTNTARKKLIDLQGQITSLNTQVTGLNTQVTGLNTQISLCYASTSYRLGRTLIHEKKALINPLKLLKKIKTIKRIRSKRGVPQKTEKNISEHKPIVTDATILKPDVSIAVPETKLISIDKKLQSKTTPTKKDTGLQDGITVAMATYQGGETIKRALDSLSAQDISKELLEIIIVINGEKDNTEAIIKDFADKNPTLSINIIVSNEKGAASARNKAIKEASRKYICLLDDDDTLSPTYLSSMYKAADEETMVLSQIINVSHNSIDASNPINIQILTTDLSIDNPYYLCPSTLTINGAKIAPTQYMKQVKMNTHLANGEDVAYFSELISKFNFKFEIVKEAVYFRFIAGSSLSRQSLSFQFNVIDRLKVIALVFSSLKNVSKKDIQYFLKQKIYAQINFINRYLDEHPTEYNKVIDEILKQGLPNFPFDKLRKNSLANNLVVSYCFTPYVDTSAVAMAKRIRKGGEVVDVVYNTMDKHRNKNENLYGIADDLIDHRIEINTHTSFSSWKGIEEFCDQMMEQLSKVRTSPYEKIYSRVMWPASNFAAFEYKLKNPDTRWIAEFSDPILYDIHGEKRYTKIEGDWHFQEIEKLFEQGNVGFPKNDNMFFWCEYLAYIFADEIIFTNQHQLDYMLSHNNKNVQDIILQKASIKSHNTLPKKYYNLVESSYQPAPSKVNIAYFGAFYQTRKLNDTIEIIKALPEAYREKVVIHVFTNTKDELEKLIIDEKLDNNFRVNDYVNFFKFLDLTTKFDCLLLNDAITKPQKSVNPYLPSKLSDYLGSGTDIWALYEKGSILSKSTDVKYKSEIGKINEGCKILEKIINDHYIVAHDRS